MMINEFLDVIDYYAPKDCISNFDVEKVGFIIDFLKYKNNEIYNIGICLDITKKVMQKSEEDKIDLIVCHHNPFFNMKYKIENDDINWLKIAFKNDISIYCIHTNYDNCKFGMNYGFCNFLKLENLEYIDGLYIGEFKKEYSIYEFVKYVSNILNINHFSYVGNSNVKKVMVCCGSGFTKENLNIGKKYGVDAFISSEWKHSNIIRKRENINLINISHYDMENIGMKYLYNELCNIFKNKNIKIKFYDDNINMMTV